MILKRELNKEKNDEMKYSHFLCTLERANQEKLKLAITQLKCVPCLNKFTTNYSLTNNSNIQLVQSYNTIETFDFFFCNLNRKRKKILFLFYF